MEVSIEIVYAVVGSLVGAIVFMASGFVYIFRKMEIKLGETESLLLQYIQAYSKLEARYAELKDEHQQLLGLKCKNEEK